MQMWFTKDLKVLSHLTLRILLKALWFNGQPLEKFQVDSTWLEINSFSHMIAYEIHILLKVSQTQVMLQLKIKSRSSQVLLWRDARWILRDISQILWWGPCLICLCPFGPGFNRCFSTQFQASFLAGPKTWILNSKWLDSIKSCSMKV